MKRSLSYLVLLLWGVALVPLSPLFGQNGNVQTDVDRAPKFKGKPSDLQKFFDKHMSYPLEARFEVIEGTVQVSAVITNEGKLVEPEIEKSVDVLLDSEALRLVFLLQEWKPGKKDGAPVDTRIKIPVSFRLSSEQKKFMNTLKEAGLTENMPLFVIDDKKVKEYIEVPHYNVKSVRVMKGEKAIERFGEDAQNGVVIINTKRGTPPVK
jgi:TonB family protein